MENLGFILWMVLYPITTSITSFIYEKKRLMIGDEKPSSGVYVLSSLISLSIYFYVATLLY